MFIVAVDMDCQDASLCCGVFPGHWQLNACSTPKRVNSRPCERNQTKLESTCCLSFVWCAIGFSWARPESVSVSEAEAWRSPVSRAQDGSERVVHFRLEVSNAAPKPREDDGSETQVVRKGPGSEISLLL